jgi:hypothetical protein
MKNQNVEPCETLTTVPSRRKARDNGKSRLPAPVTNSPAKGGPDCLAILKQAFRLSEDGKGKGSPFGKAMADIKALLSLKKDEQLPKSYLTELRKAEKAIFSDAFVKSVETLEKLTVKRSNVLRGKEASSMSIEEVETWKGIRKLSVKEQLLRAMSEAQTAKDKVANICGREMPDTEDKCRAAVTSALRLKARAARFYAFAAGGNASGEKADCLKGKFRCNLTGWAQSTHQRMVKEEEAAKAKEATEAAKAEAAKAAKVREAKRNAKRNAERKQAAQNSGRGETAGDMHKETETADYSATAGIQAAEIINGARK